LGIEGKREKGETKFRMERLHGKIAWQLNEGLIED